MENNENINGQEQIYNLIFEEDDITWQSMIYELARTQHVDPWDIDISVLAKEYIKMIQKLKELNFRLSGKVVLAAAILLKLKTDRLGLEQLISLTQEEYTGEVLDEGGDLVEEDHMLTEEKRFKKASLKVRIPGPRRRKVTVFELVDALKKALEVDERRQERILEIKRTQHKPVEIKKIDIFAKIEVVYLKLKEFIQKYKKNTVEFTQIIPSKAKRDVIWTFIPLLHLANQDKIELRQEQAFGKIYVVVKQKEFKKGLIKK